MKSGADKKRVCPHCGAHYNEHPALSRVDNETLICPDCGVREALESFGVTDVAQQNSILESIHGVRHLM